MSIVPVSIVPVSIVLAGPDFPLQQIFVFKK